MKKPKILDTTPLPLSQLEEDPTNPNHMSDEQMAALVHAIEVAGFLQPCLVRRIGPNRYKIIDGHHRAAAASKAGLSQVPCVVVETDDEAAAILQIGMNKLRGELNLGEVARVIADLDAKGWTKPELVMTGFSEAELDDLLRAAQPSTDEEVAMGALGGSSDDAPEREDSDPGGPFELTIPFASKGELQRAKRGLRKHAGKGRELGQALLDLLVLQE